MSSQNKAIPARGTLGEYQANVKTPDEGSVSAQGESADGSIEAQGDMTFTLKDAETLSPKRIQNRIVRDVNNLSDTNSFLMNDAFPLYRMGDYEEVYHRLSGLRMPMPGSSLVSESPIAGIEGFTEDSMSTTTLKEKISPEKALNTVLNANADIVDVGEIVSDSLRHDLMTSRSLMAWRGYNGVPGMIGVDGQTSHPELSGDHTITGNDFSDTSASTPNDVFSTATERISKDGNLDEDVGPITAYVGTDTLWDLFKNDNLETRLSNDQIQQINNTSGLEAVLPVDRVIEIRTDIVRTNANGEPVDTNGNVVSVDNAAEENILEPVDGTGTAQRNIVIGAFGQGSGVMPWHLDRLADHIGAAPQGQFSMDMENGFLLQGWTDNDPVISWRKSMQEIGLELIEPDNYVVLQGV